MPPSPRGFAGSLASGLSLSFAGRHSVAGGGRNRGTIFEVMHTIMFGMHLVAAIFFIGLAGSSIVVAISFVEDLYELFGKE